MRTQPSPAPEHVAGLIDGLITLQWDIFGSLSLQVTLGPTGPAAQPGGGVIEIGLSAEMALHLSRLLLSGDGQALGLPCQVGVRA